MATKKIALVPLDDRPCNLKFPQKLARSAGLELITPPENILGSFKVSGDCDAIISWIKATAGRVDSMVVSTEMLAFGGLISSRRANVPQEIILRRSGTIKELKGLNFNLNVFLFSLIMRVSPSPDLGIDPSVWRQLLKYSDISDRVEVSGLMDDKVQKSLLEKEIPAGVLGKYLAKRKLNHEANLAAVGLVNEGFADLLIIGEDDASKHGLHRKEKRELEGLVSELALEEKIKLICGADEIGMMLIARAALDEDHRPKVFVVPSDVPSMDLVPIYEDRAFSISVEEHIASVGAVTTENRDDADILLFINAPIDEDADLYLKGPRPLKRTFDAFIKDLKRGIDSNKTVCLVDAAYANGAEPEFMKALLQHVDISRLSAFAAWNTASNSLGSALAQAVLAKGNKSFLLERFIDDYLYQTELRPKIKKDLEDKSVSILDLQDKYPTVNWVVKKELGNMAGDFAKTHFKGLAGAKFDINLPWPRIFEVDVDVV